MGVRVYADAEADMLLAEASSAICVQRIKPQAPLLVVPFRQFL